MKKKKSNIGKVVFGINLDRKVVEFLDQMADEMETSRSQVANYSIRQIMRETEILKEKYPECSNMDVFDWFAGLNKVALSEKSK
jgi:hypothetical protein